MAVPTLHWSFSIADVERMLDAGILMEDDRVELIQGEIIAMSPIGASHVYAVNTLTRLLVDRTDDEVLVQVQSPIELPDGSAPQPDVAIIRANYQRRRLPTASDTLLLIEVADSSRDFDRNTKFPLYAAAGILEAWLFDLLIGRIERHTQPGPNGYELIALAERGKSLPSTVLPSITLAIEDVFDFDE